MPNSIFNSLAVEAWARDMLVKHGLVLGNRDLIIGVKARCGTVQKPYSQNGFYLFHLDSNPNITIINRNDGHGGEEYVEKYLTDKQYRAIPQKERDDLKRKYAEQAERRRKEQEEAHRKAAEQAKAIFQVLAHAGPENPYIRCKGVVALGDARKGDAANLPFRNDLKGQLLVLSIVNDNDEIMSLQAIDGAGNKDFFKGGKKRGCFFPMQARDGRKDGPLCIAEGYATAASIHLATGYACRAAFDCHNLLPVAEAARRKYPDRKIIVCADNDCTHKDGRERTEQENAGVQAGRAAADAVGAALAVCPSVNGMAADFNDLHLAQGLDAVKKVIDAALDQIKNPEGPLPLRRPPQEQAEYPVNAFLGFAQTVEDVATLTNTPSSMVGGTLLAVLSLLAQRHVNVKTRKFITPIVIFVLIVGETGDGKSLVERILTKPARDKEKMLLQAYEDDLKDYLIEMKAYERELKRLDAKKNLSREAYAAELAELEKTRPSVPVKPVFIIGDFNYEGLFRNLKEGLPYIGIFTDEGGRLFGGTAFSQENMMKTIANLTTVWSGGAWDKMRAGEGVTKLYDRRICASVMVQPEIAERIFSDKLMSGQGYLCRQLVSWPVPMMKSPEQTEIESMPSVQFFYRQCEILLDLPVRTDEGNGIIFDDLDLSPDALDAYKAFFTYIEERRTEGGMYEPVNGYAKRAAEQALRIAGCLSMGLNPACRVITLEVMEAGIKIAEWYLDEILRITLDDMASPEVLAAERLLKWLHDRRLERTSIRQILQYGPGALREKKAVVPVIDMLAEHGWLVPLPEGGMVIMGSKENYARQAWKVVYAVPDKD